jgi:hypothetical protein
MVCSQGGMIEPNALPRSILASPESYPPRPHTSRTPVRAADERKHPLHALGASCWNRNRAVARLELDRTTAWRTMRCADVAVPSSPVGLERNPGGFACCKPPSHVARASARS